MRKTFVVIIVLCINSIAFGEPVRKVEQPLTPDQTRQLRKDVKSLAEAFGIETPKNEMKAPTEESQKGDQSATATPTMAKVADKALDMASGLISSVAATVEKVAPRVWTIMVRQQYAKAFSDLLLPWGLFMITLTAFLLMKKYWKNCEKLDLEYCSACFARLIFKTIVPVLGLVIFVIWGCVELSCSIKYLVNPEFYAIRDLLLMLLNKGQGL